VWAVPDARTRGAHLSDAVRLALVYSHGGVYLDSDELLLRPSALAGVFRFVCSNGMVVGSTYAAERTLHAGEAALTLIERMKADAVFLNTSRGFVVDHAALARALRSNPGMLAILDVHEPEPVQGN
jgi:hypothetical protein